MRLTFLLGRGPFALLRRLLILPIRFSSASVHFTRRLRHGLLDRSVFLNPLCSVQLIPRKADRALAISFRRVFGRSTANRGSFELVQTIYDKMLEQTGAEWAPCVIVGNKSDLNTTRYAVISLSCFLQALDPCFPRSQRVEDADSSLVLCPSRLYLDCDLILFLQSRLESRRSGSRNSD